MEMAFKMLKDRERGGKNPEERRKLYREIGKELEGHDIMGVETNEVSRKCMLPIP